MGELTTLHCAVTGQKYLRTTVPSFIVDQFHLAIGDKLEWELAVGNGEIVVRIIPRKV
ncbi:MAG: AbrB family transcriptional regulator [Nitrososphaerota archaeon]|nr:AbrB family transcriptional regulator [Nitrososphaerota archaeon]